MVKFLLWRILFLLCWPLAVLAIVVYPLVWLILLPFRLAGIAYVAAGHRMDDPMARLKGWMERNNAAMLAGVLVLIGGLVLYHGVTALL